MIGNNNYDNFVIDIHYINTIFKIKQKVLLSIFITFVKKLLILVL